jgi:hypothetical protein
MATHPWSRKSFTDPSAAPSPSGRRGPSRRRRRLRPAVTALEGRTLLSILVNNPTDTPVAGKIDLREAIAQANGDGGATRSSSTRRCSAGRRPSP